MLWKYAWLDLWSSVWENFWMHWFVWKNIDQIHFPFFLTKGIEMKLEETMASAKEHLFLMVIAQPSQLFLALNFRLEKKYWMNASCQLIITCTCRCTSCLFSPPLFNSIYKINKEYLAKVSFWTAGYDKDKMSFRRIFSIYFCAFYSEISHVSMAKNNTNHFQNGFAKSNVI